MVKWAESRQKFHKKTRDRHTFVPTDTKFTHKHSVLRGCAVVDVRRLVGGVLMFALFMEFATDIEQ